MSSSMEQPELVLCGGCGDKGCAFVCYCSAACQTAAWSAHKGPCNIKKKEKKAREKAKEAAKEPGSGSGSGSGLTDMGSIMAALMAPQPQPQQQRYQDAYVFNACFHNHHEELQKILRQQQPRLDVDWAQPSTGATAAFASAQQGHDKCLAQLISNGADLSKTDKGGFAPIHIACQYGRYACIELLADNRVDLNLPLADKHGCTPAMVCCRNGHVKCLALLSDKGADLSLASHLGGTAAHVASQYGQLKCLQLLGKRCVELSKKDANGSTPLDYARSCKHLECVDYLLTSGATGRRVEDIKPLSEAVKVM
jgi:hypothetical protein